MAEAVQTNPGAFDETQRQGAPSGDPGGASAAEALDPRLDGQLDESVWRHPVATPLPGTITGATLALGRDRLLMIHKDHLCLSSDDGRTWLRSRLNGVEGATGWEETMLRSASGALVLIYRDSRHKCFEWDNERHELASEPRLEVWASRSIDDGRTWSEPVKVFGGYCGSIINAIQTRSGRLVVPVQVMLRNPGRHGQTTCVSDDDGRTWRQSNIIDIGGHGHHDGGFEGSVVELRDGRLWMVLRTNLERMWQAWSEDQGLSWRTIAPTAIDASSSPACLARLSSGRIMMAWNRLYPEGLSDLEKQQWERAGGDCNICEPLPSWHRRELSVAFSEDDGEHWTTPVVLMRGKQCSYPMILERRPGLIWVATRFGPRVGAAFQEDALLAAVPADSLRSVHPAGAPCVSSSNPLEGHRT